MNRRDPAQVLRARRLLAHESATGGAGDEAAAAAHLFNKLHAQLAPLIGSAGVQALLVRSFKLTRGEFSFLETSAVESATQLRACLQAQEPKVALEAAAALFGTFFTVVTAYIGDRLTTAMLRGAWPTLQDSAPLET